MAFRKRSFRRGSFKRRSRVSKFRRRNASRQRPWRVGQRM